MSRCKQDKWVKHVYFHSDSMSVELMDKRTIVVPLSWYPRLLNATMEQRSRWAPCGSGYGIHWEAIDEDLSVEGLLRKARSPES